VTADLNGVALTLSGPNVFEFGSLAPANVNGPLVLTITGKSGAAGGIFASYAGTLNVRVVPEPAMASLGLLGAALSGLAWRKRRIG
jgi:hypothetical protein